MSESYRVVILDDEPWSREVVKSLGRWTDLGLSVVAEADDGEAGLVLIDRCNPHILITDMRMPGIDGVALLQEVSSRHPNIRIIVMSGYDDFAYLRQALRSKAEDYLLKPIDPDELNRALEACVGRLEQQQDERPSSLRTPMSFADPAVVEEYVDHRRRAFAFLLELDARGVERTLEDLQRGLREHGVSIDVDLSSRIAYDYVLLLEEFLVRSGGTVDPGLTRAKEVFDPAGGDVFHAVARLYAQAIDRIQADRRKADHLDLAEVKEHIDHYYADPLSLHSVARLFLVSKEHLSRVFRKEFGVTVNDYITERRMEKAQHLLEERELEIKQIALLVGYGDLTYFYRVFKKRFGYPPGQVRSTHSNGTR